MTLMENQKNAGAISLVNIHKSWFSKQFALRLRKTTNNGSDENVQDRFHHPTFHSSIGTHALVWW